MFDCPNCKQQAKRLIAGLSSDGKLYCNLCYERKGSIFNWQLHDIVADDGKTRVTKGKASEIDSRMVSPEDKHVVINRHTGRPTQR